MIKKIIFATMGVMCATAVFAEGPLRLGMTPEPFMPVTSIDASGKWIGYEADLSTAICAEIAEGCEIKQMAWDALLPALREGKVDFVVGAFSITDERRKAVDFSLPYEVPTSSVAGPKSDTQPVNATDAPHGKGKVLSPEGLEDKIFGVQNSSTQARYMAEYAPSLEVKAYDAADSAIADLQAGRIDYIVMGDGYLEGFLKSSDGQDYEEKLKLPDDVVLGEGIAYAVRKGDKTTLEKIDGPLSKMKTDGSLETILEKWQQ